MNRVKSLNPWRRRSKFEPMTLPIRDDRRDETATPNPASTTTTLVNPVPIQPARPAPVAPYDRVYRAPGIKVTALEVRELHELIRKRYSLDVELWALRKAKARNRRLVEHKMRQASAALTKIMNTVELWDTPDAWTSFDDWQRLRAVKRNLEMPGKRDWMKHPPWEEDAAFTPIDEEVLETHYTREPCGGDTLMEGFPAEKGRYYGLGY